MNGFDEERRARAALSWLTEGASPKLSAMIGEYGAGWVWGKLSELGNSAWARRAEHFDLDDLLRRSAAAGVRFVVPGDDEWPESLEELGHVEVQNLGGPPVGLWLKGPGHLREWADRSVAIVGSRSCSPYGEHVATDLAMDLAGLQTGPAWTVVSGGAYGIDGWAHRGAIAAHGQTVAVIGSGLDRPYPAGNHALFDQMVLSQLMVSEMPVGMHPTRVGFLARNRLLAALSRGTVVVEATARSGAANTANWAASLGRVVMAVPGSVHSAQSVTPHRLIRDSRACLVTGAKEVLSLVSAVGEAPELPLGGPGRLLDQLDPDSMRVREALPGRGAMVLGELIAATGFGAQQCLASLAKMETSGLVRRNELGEWELSEPRR